MRLDHCCLNVRDMDAAIAFYQEHFGMKLLSRRDVEATNAEIAFVGYEDDGMKLELTHWRDWGDDDYTDGSNFDHIAVIVEDVDGLVATLGEAGVKIAMKPFDMGGSGSRIAFVHDLDGNWVELIERG